MRTAIFVQNRPMFGTQLIHIPLMAAFRRAPDDEVIAFTPYEGGNLFTETGVADAVRHYHRGTLAVARTLRHGAFDMVVTLRPQSAWLNLAVGVSGVPSRVGFAGPLARLTLTSAVARDTDIYRAATYMELARAAGRPAEMASVFRGLANQVPAASSGGPTYCLMPAGGAGSFKRWPLECFVGVAARLASRSPRAGLIWILGPDEAGLADAIRGSEVGERSRVLTAPSIAEIARAVLDSEAVVANDCGPAHVAQMLCAPMVSVFSDHDGTAATRVREWFNRHARAEAVVGPRGGAISEVQPETVFDALRRVLAPA